MVDISDKSPIMAQANVNICFSAADINSRRLKFSIFSCSLDFYLMEIQGKVLG
jgi:hypothetical protein